MLGPETTAVLDRFPKIRAELPPEFRAIYEEHYRSNREGQTVASGLAQRMEAWMHWIVARDRPRRGEAAATLEIGAGTFNHLPYEPDTTPYDVVEPFEALYRHSPHRHRIRTVYPDIADVPPDAGYRRIISVATFEHICNLPEVVARAGLLLAPGGRLRTAIPSEGHLLWTLGWKLTTGLEFRLRRGLDYGVLLRHEHVNQAAEIVTVLRAFFRSVSVQLCGVSRALSLYQFIDCSSPEVAACQRYLARLAPRSLASPPRLPEGQAAPPSP